MNYSLIQLFETQNTFYVTGTNSLYVHAAKQRLRHFK